jgi:gas vesicle protein
MISNLKSVVALLDQIIEGAARAEASTQRLAATAETASTSLQSLQSLQSLLSEKSTQTTQTLQTNLTAIQTLTDTTHTHITDRFDDLQNAIADHTNLWNKAVSELVDAVKIGAVPIEQLIHLYGNAQIGGERLVDYLKGLDFSFYRNHVAELIQGLHDGSVEIARVQEYLGKTQLLFAKQLSDIIELFRKGSVTLKRVEEIVKDIKKAFPDSEFSDLAQALYDALRKG